MDIFKDVKLADNEIYLEIYELLEENENLDNPAAYRFYIKTINDNNIAGRCSFRVGHSENRHIKNGGNIGYDIDIPYRGNKYSLKACKLLLVLARLHHMKLVRITCPPENKASRRICELLGADFISVFDLPKDDYNYIKHGTKQHCIYEMKL